MFREMRRFKQQITTEECKKVLKEEKRAAFSVIGDEGYPYTIPINFYYDEAAPKYMYRKRQVLHLRMLQDRTRLRNHLQRLLISYITLRNMPRLVQSFLRVHF